MTDQYPRGTAYHEAAHAIVAWVLGLRVGLIEVKHEDASGRTDIACADAMPFIDQLAVCLAGAMVTEVFKEPTHPLACFCDLNRARMLLKGLSDEEEGRRLRDLGRDRALAHLKNHETEVRRVAERLIEYGRVSEAEFLHLMNGEAI